VKGPGNLVNRDFRQKPRRGGSQTRPYASRGITPRFLAFSAVRALPGAYTQPIRRAKLAVRKVTRKASPSVMTTLRVAHRALRVSL